MFFSYFKEKNPPIFLLGPVLCGLIVLMPTPEGMSLPAHRLMGVAAWMALWWLTQVKDLSVTALLPLVLFPLFSIEEAATVPLHYANPIIYLFLGGFILSNAIQQWGLHKTLSIAVLRAFGVTTRRVVGAVICSVASISMWISNTATAMMMVPVVMAIITAAHKDGKDPHKRLSSALLLALCYGASIGGMMTLVGTPPNAVFMGHPQSAPVTFLNWMCLAIPLSVLLLTLLWTFLCFILLEGQDVCIVDENDLVPEPLNGPQKAIIVVFASVVAAWIFLPHPMMVAIGAAILLMCLPNGKGGALLEWKDARNINWDVLLLLGGGFALAEAFETTGLGNYLAERLQKASVLGPFGSVWFMSCAVIAMSEFCSNTAVATLLLPIAARLADVFHMHPLHLMLAVTLASSCGFMLPIATPPNAIAFGTQELKLRHMMRTGFLMDVFASFLIAVFSYYLAPFIIGF